MLVWAVLLVSLLSLVVHLVLLHRRHLSSEAPLPAPLLETTPFVHTTPPTPPRQVCGPSAPHRLLGRGVHVAVFLDRPEDSSHNGFFCDFVRSFVSRSGQVPLKVLGWTPGLGQRPQRHTREFFLGSKVTVLLAYLAGLLRQDLAETDDLVLFADATDVVWQRPVLDIFRLFLDQSCDILLGVEKDCWPPSFLSLYPAAPESAVYRHINSGSFVGRLSALVRFLEEATLDLPRYRPHELFYDVNGRYLNHRSPQQDTSELAPPVYRRNDQIVLSMLYFERKHNVSLDFGAQMFQSYQLSHADIAAELHWNGQKSRVVHIPDTVPIALHFNGPSKIHYTPELRSRLKSTWLPDREVEDSHSIYLVNRAFYPSPFDTAGVDYQIGKKLFKRFAFSQTCSEEH